MNLIIFLLFIFPASVMAACPPEMIPHALDLANTKTVRKLQTALNRSVAKDAASCAKDLREKRKDLLIWINYLDQNIDSMAAEEERWAKGILDRKIPGDASTDVACQHSRNLAELINFYERADKRSDYFYGKLNSIANVLLNIRAENQIFTQPAKAKLLLQCRDEFREHSMDFEDEGDETEVEDDRREICLQRADATPELWDAVKLKEKKPAGSAASLACLLDPKIAKQVELNLNVAKNLDQGAKVIITRTNKYFDGLSQKIPERIGQILAAQAALEKWKCAKWQAAEDKKIAASMRKLQSADGHGTGFLLAGPAGKTDLISARHVGFRNESLAPQSLKTLGPSSEKQPGRGIAFEVKPGSYDRGRDLIKRSLASASASLIAVNEGDVMPPGEKVKIYGYPAIREGKLSSLGCEIKGVGRNEFDNPGAESYLLSCPGAESHIGGMSGGPVMNQKGEVIGVVSAHNPLTNMVVVQPVNRNAKGENRFGFQSIFLYENCFDGTDMAKKPRRCQIIPGLTFQKSGP